ncbi:dethiobiotin synthase [Idiomarina tyrosinivorans]|uniref:ATP-dependent dethiobiotin synthetase BioD n=1 Tax=Idiomarina tyrosinivorans TaxID=1445662 RepID=A0A432ZU41_9GAMM|nr:dethiobiotin synthase [Idiomarina tyrosinivorans]RUO81338.1 dethiobiotin synthase [Idiomarina tyrosinivorans]
MAELLFVTGTDTDAGKTVAAVALLNALNASGLRTLAMKPLATGCENIDGQWQNSDARYLRAHCSEAMDYTAVNPWAFVPAIAPHIAAEEAQITISNAEVLEQFQRLRQQSTADVALIEGAGGWRLPLSHSQQQPVRYLSEVVAAAKAKVILVVGLKLGCLNHAKLTELAIAADGAECIGWIGVQTTPNPMPYQAENIATLKRSLASPNIGLLDFNEAWTSMEFSRAIDVKKVRQALLK